MQGERMHTRGLDASTRCGYRQGVWILARGGIACKGSKCVRVEQMRARGANVCKGIDCFAQGDWMRARGVDACKEGGCVNGERMRPRDMNMCKGMMWGGGTLSGGREEAP
eukprot:scaffold281632_cov15-Tisochrysis_lutea.AAC.1